MYCWLPHKGIWVLEFGVWVRGFRSGSLEYLNFCSDLFWFIFICSEPITISIQDLPCVSIPHRMGCTPKGVDQQCMTPDHSSQLTCEIDHHGLPATSYCTDCGKLMCNKHKEEGINSQATMYLPCTVIFYMCCMYCTCIVHLYFVSRDDTW